MKMKDAISSGVSHNTLAQGTFIKGDIKAEEDIRIDGKVEGTINCPGKVIIGHQAEIQGDIRCANMDLIGIVTGNIFVDNTFSMRANGVFSGELTAGSLEIEPGATFNGTCKMQ
ncbi:MAG: polymer-forming cytoskeletal protein [Dysgonamonadaceae bacterium]|jgi:cytoskeletal protein CcmA (bactofilin family)|nr:polymer-forming cytoskeletal protein [Dysgonamonadaceae bacterium]